MKVLIWFAENLILVMVAFFISELYTWHQWQAYVSVILAGFLVALHDVIVKLRLENK